MADPQPPGNYSRLDSIAVKGSSLVTPPAERRIYRWHGAICRCSLELSRGNIQQCESKRYEAIF